MYILAIDSSTPVAGVAILKNEELIAESFLNTKNKHSEKLMPMVETILAQVDLDISEIGAIAFAKGPGSFTGLRIGMVTAKCLAQVLGCKIISIPTLDFLAYNCSEEASLICPVIRARRNEVYTALFKKEGAGLLRLTEYLALEPEKLALSLKNRKEKVIFLGDGLDYFRDILKDTLKENFSELSLNSRYPRASSLGILAFRELEKGQEDDLFRLSPLYLRKSEAEINWEKQQCQR